MIDAVDLPLLLVLAGTVLMILEAMAPGANFIVLGVALFLAGLIGMTFGPLGAPLALAGMVLLFGAAAFWVYNQVDFYGSEAGRTKDSDSLKGEQGRVTETVTPTDGEIKLDGGGFNPYYQARSMEGTIEEGEEVMVVDPGGGNVVTVEPVDMLGADGIDRALERDRQQKARDVSERDTTGDDTPGSSSQATQEDDLEREGPS